MLTCFKHHKALAGFRKFQDLLQERTSLPAPFAKYSVIGDEVSVSQGVSVDARSCGSICHEGELFVLPAELSPGLADIIVKCLHVVLLLQLKIRRVQCSVTLAKIAGSFGVVLNFGPVLLRGRCQFRQDVESSSSADPHRIVLQQELRERGRIAALKFWEERCKIGGRLGNRNLDAGDGWVYRLLDGDRRWLVSDC